MNILFRHFIIIIIYSLIKPRYKQDRWTGPTRLIMSSYSGPLLSDECQAFHQYNRFVILLVLTSFAMDAKIIIRWNQLAYDLMIHNAWGLWEIAHVHHIDIDMLSAKILMVAIGSLFSVLRWAEFAAHWAGCFTDMWQHFLWVQKLRLSIIAVQSARKLEKIPVFSFVFVLMQDIRTKSRCWGASVGK